MNKPTFLSHQRQRALWLFEVLDSENYELGTQKEHGAPGHSSLKVTDRQVLFASSFPPAHHRSHCQGTPLRGTRTP